MTQRNLLFFVWLAASAAAPPQGSAPVLIAPTEPGPAVLAAKAAEAFREWASYKPDLFDHLFDHSAAEVLEELRGKKSRMEKYKQAQDEYYARIYGDSERSLKDLRQSGGTNWSRFRDESVKAGMEQVAMMRSQELRLQELINNLSLRPGKEAAQQRVQFDLQRQALAKARQDLATEVADRMASDPDPAAGRKKVLELEDENLKQIAHLRELDAKSRDELATMYDSLTHAVEAKAAPLQPRNSAPSVKTPDLKSASDSDAALPPGRKNPPAHWIYEGHHSGASYRLELTRKDSHNGDAVLRIRKSGEAPGPQEVKFTFQIKGEDVTSMDAEPPGKVTLRSPAPIGNSAPAKLTLDVQVSNDEFNASNIELKLKPN